MTFFQAQFKKLRDLVQLLSNLSLEIRCRYYKTLHQRRIKSLLGIVQMYHLHSD